MRIKPSEDSKTKFAPGQKNSFGLAPGPEFSCPGATDGEGGCWMENGRKTCYVWKLSLFRKSMSQNLKHNFDILSGCSGAQRVELLENEFKRFLYSCENAGERFYRLHWSGDIFSPSYAKDLMFAAARVPEMTFWNFTRNFDPGVIRAIVESKPPNLVQYLSADDVNMKAALKTYKAFPGVFAMSYMGESKAEFEKQWASVSDKPVRDCPSNRKHGKVDYLCKKCKMCLKGECVFFKTRK